MIWSKDSLKEIITKSLSILLIVSGLYHLLLSSLFVLIIYPRSLNSDRFVPLIIQEGLIEKALVLYLTTIVEGLYGLSLLFRPKQEVGLFHLLVGIIIFFFSFFFITETRLTTDPLWLILQNIISGN